MQKFLSQWNMSSNHAVENSSAKVNSSALGATATLPAPDESQIPAKAKQHNIRVSPAVLEAAGKDGDDLLRSLHTASTGLTQSEADSRVRIAGPNEVAQERQRGWFISLLVIIRNPLVILLAVLSSISFATGDPRAGSVMAGMIVLSVALRFLQEARAGAAAAKLKATIHVTLSAVSTAQRWFHCRSRQQCGDCAGGAVAMIESRTTINER